tara:strand:+ start:279 stop:473 length:195 start_codon:yes stop_codon:yes gene_type:complete
VGKRIVIYYDNLKAEKRYQENWNPLGVPMLFLDEYDWHPSPEYVYQSYINWLHAEGAVSKGETK